MPKMVTPNMPLKTAMPRVLRISAPAPLARTSGTTPRMKAKDVIKMGRSRSRHASTVASTRPLPPSWSCLANSTMRMAFLAASPIRTTGPICVKILLSIRASRVRAGVLVPHELNFRLHPDLQRSALESLYQQVGFARSLLAYELPDGRLKLLDGHLRPPHPTLSPRGR